MKKLLLISLFFFGVSIGHASEPPVVVIVGDSLTEGYGIAKETAYPALVEKKLNSEGVPVRVINAGISGSTTASGMERLRWQLKNSPAIVMIALGANDGLRGIPRKATEKNLDDMISLVKKSKSVALLAEMKLPPNYGKKEAAEFEVIYSRLAKKHSIRLIPFILAGVAGDSKLNQEDGIHPNEKGNVIVADAVGKVLKVELEKLKGTNASKDVSPGK